MQTVSDSLNGMAEIQSGGEWFATTLDLKDMFYSIPIHDPYGILNICVDGQMFSWKVCPQGYRKAPALAVAVMNGTIDSFARTHPKTADIHIWTYVDDVVIMGHDHTVVRMTTAKLKDHLSDQGWTRQHIGELSRPLFSYAWCNMSKRRQKITTPACKPCNTFIHADLSTVRAICTRTGAQRPNNRYKGGLSLTFPAILDGS
ncbi:hypothetical protein Y1Q_0010129 [Alligator mississippiensis]|uniref:ribonuclease H n=1 Tax=Alligator mississippiensis TaxID=8496 RepID=A0A151NFX6_ALLMI|nr:hypothetical protein Y1Q_0010129 [Alligator mississippiensis]